MASKRLVVTAAARIKVVLLEASSNKDVPLQSSLNVVKTFPVVSYAFLDKINKKPVLFSEDHNFHWSGPLRFVQIFWV